MRWFILLALLTLSTSSMLAQFEQHRWEHRLILIFADNTSQDIYQQQWSDLQADSTGLADRDILIYTLFPQGSPPKLDESLLIAIQKKYNPEKRPFLCILIGKDGSIKSSKTTIYHRQEIFRLIDSMPMRQAEMRRKRRRKNYSY